MNPTTQLEQYQSQTPDPPTSQVSREAPEDLLDCPYGRRYIRRVTDDGDVVYDEVPLTLEDLLHPEEEDELVAVLGHSKDCGRLSTGLDRLTPQNKTFVVLEDVNVDLGLPGVKPIRPDVSVFEVAAIPDGLPDMGTFDMKQHAAVPVLFIEVTSGSTRPNDLGPKFRMYQQAKVQQFILVDRVHPSGTARLVGFEYRGRGFVELQPDPQGRFRLPAFDLWIGLEDGVAVLYDANGLVPNSEGLAKQLEDERLSSQQHQQQAEQRVEDEKRRTEKALQRAETEKQRAEREKQRAEREKQRAEREKLRAEREKLRAEREKLRANDEQQRTKQARQRAEQEKQRAEQAQLQVDAERIRADSAQERLRELEAELARLRSQ